LTPREHVDSLKCVLQVHHYILLLLPDRHAPDHINIKGPAERSEISEFGAASFNNAQQPIRVACDRQVHLEQRRRPGRRKQARNLASPNFVSFHILYLLERCKTRVLNMRRFFRASPVRAQTEFRSRRREKLACDLATTFSKASISIC